MAFVTDQLPSDTKWRRVKAECQTKGQLFEDSHFPAEYTSIDPNMPEDIRPYIVWRRPHELVQNPQMFTAGAGREDIKQGTLGNCWFLASLGSLTMSPSSLNKVVPKDQNFDDPDYCGCFRFNFWQYGRWKQFIIDDRLPTYNGRLIFTHSVEENEFWPCLVEKAYASVYGSYVALKGGQMSEALVDFTGGIGEDINLKDETRRPHDLYEISQKAFKNESLMGCAIKPLDKIEDGIEDTDKLEEATDPTKASNKEAVLDNGLVAGHAYSITSVEVVTRELPPGFEDPRPEVGWLEKKDDGRVLKKENLYRIRNPWGNEQEWNGAWSDDSDEWNYVSAEEKKRIGYTEEDDGEFWICYEDFIENFDNMTLCHNTDMKMERVNFGLTEFDGQWMRGFTDGGCRNNLETFALNNQYRLQLEDSDEDGDGLCTIICSLMQKNYRGAGKKRLTIGFSLYKIEDEGLRMEKLNTDYFVFHKAACKPLYMNTREVVLRADVPPGLYSIIPTTFEQGVEGLFYMRIMTEQSGSKTDHMRVNFQSEISTYRELTEQDREMVEKLHEMYVKESKGLGFIGARGIQKILSELKPSMAPDRDCVWALISFFDEDRSGKIDEREFVQMWKFYEHANELMVSKFGAVKDPEDEEESESDEAHNPEDLISVSELRPCLSCLGVVISADLAGRALQRYSDDGKTLSCNDVIVIMGKVNTTHIVGEQMGLNMQQQEHLMALSFAM